MARLPDRFDLWVRKAQECGDALRQADYILGALAGLKHWYFAAAEDMETTPVQCEIEGKLFAPIFSDHERIEEMELGPTRSPFKIFSMPGPAAWDWCVERRTGLLVNPSVQRMVLIPFDQVKAFHAERQARTKRHSTGFWIPHMTSEEEDFWQEHGL